MMLRHRLLAVAGIGALGLVATIGPAVQASPKTSAHHVTQPASHPSVATVSAHRVSPGNATKPAVPALTSTGFSMKGAHTASKPLVPTLSSSGFVATRAGNAAKPLVPTLSSASASSVATTRMQMPTAASHMMTAAVGHITTMCGGITA